MRDVKEQITVKFDPTNEELLLEEVKKGNQEAWEFITRQLYVPLYNFILSMVRHQENAQELVQDVFVNFWAKRDQIVINTSLKAYLYRAARNHSLNFIKRRKFELDYQRKIADTPSPTRNDTEETFYFNQLETKLAAAIESLPEKCREIFLMSRYHDMTYKDIADALDIPVRTVHYQIGLALKELREKLKYDYSPEMLASAVALLVTVSFALPYVCF